MKAQILESAKELFQKKGIKSVTIDDIAHKLSISKKTIYGHFQHKEEIADAVLEKILFENYQKIEAIKSHLSDPLDQIFQILWEISSIIENTNPLFIEEIRKSFTGSYSKFHEYLNTYFFASISEILVEGKKRKLFRQQIIAEVIARYGFELIRSSIRTHTFSWRQLNTSDIYKFFLYGIVTEAGRQKLESYSFRPRRILS